MSDEREAVIYFYENVGGLSQPDLVDRVGWSLTEQPAVIYFYENAE